mmetsp:Transcript_45996/g.144276  ORF Transcript_45996/g.144276 Transcript_45996/m.144276 type:complete len:192 (-) Transcript_45996:75-650(-)
MQLEESALLQSTPFRRYVPRRFQRWTRIRTATLIFSTLRRRWLPRAGFDPSCEAFVLRLDEISFLVVFFSFLRRDFTSRISSAEHPPNPVLCFACDIAAATLATTFSSPFNYARNIMYSSPPGVRELKTMTLIGGLFKKAARQRNVWQSMVFLQNNLKIGVATLRVAFSMALAASTYRTYTAFEKKEKSEV